jgi:hypothetical protein
MDGIVSQLRPLPVSWAGPPQTTTTTNGWTRDTGCGFWSEAKHTCGRNTEAESECTVVNFSLTFQLLPADLHREQMAVKCLLCVPSYFLSPEPPGGMVRVDYLAMNWELILLKHDQMRVQNL